MSALRAAWRQLGIAPTKDSSAIRSAYAAALKSIDPDTDPTTFQALRQAREQALAYARNSDDRLAVAPETLHSHIEIPLTPWSPDPIAAPDLPNGTMPGNLSAIVPSVEGDFLSFARPAPIDGVGQLLPTAHANGSLTPPVLGGATTSSTIESLTLNGAPVDEAHYRAVLGILFGEDGRQQPLSDETVRRELIAHAEALLNNPRMSEIAFYTEAERWFAQVIAAAAPRSDPIAHLALDHFGWLADRGRFDQRPEIAAVVARYDMLAFHAAVQKEGHPLHRAWRELITPADELSRRGHVSGKQIAKLLELVRRDFPDLEQSFDWYRVSLWETHPTVSRGGSGNLSWLGWLWPAFVLLSALGRCNAEAPRPPIISEASDTAFPTVGLLHDLHSSDDDIEAAVAMATTGELSLRTIKENNPDLARLLVADWDRARSDKEPRSTFIERTSAGLRDRFQNGLVKASYPLISDYRSFQRDEARLAGSRSIYACDDYFTKGSLPGSRSPLYQQRLSKMMARGLIEMDAEPPEKDIRGSFVIPGTVITDAIKRSGLSGQRFRQAVQGKGSAEERCKARIGLIEAALALPRSPGLKLLRDM
ncbi:MAG: hypothetical protein P0Y59_10135 [Candidatus Sphingomonas phytovorans]|nr:hypothetical protein [Sphingomonas sp.]WEK02011.1 MAG: hypothetical protein P0Y59_10135 [Sphingomonas sp.]